ncbi:GNAT family N-acetyltransferase (plasmid) [Rahnella aquatilis]|uniref:GNAT family N-acetyltransferase n=1 Tax=Rahnella perminowiae TaxID=2816244 RepID=UPI001C221871|nr:GNAT family N-acetyltransferase [Rahnella perminowiae]UJD92615.1 GNAT family N-acetyltransferase [Rahnella aquatilis]
MVLARLRIISETEKTQLWDLLSDYLHELSQYGEVNIEYPFFSSYWTDADRWPYFIESGETVVGFILVNTWSPSGKGTDFGLAEFYVLPQFRGLNIGKSAFSSLLNLHPGRWELSVMQDNETAKKFWSQLIYSCGVLNKETAERGGELNYRFATIVA